jgi:hypothetical protein
MEFMLSEALPIYSGGLGNVAGDQLKTASDLGVPVVGVGLLCQQGYSYQVIDKEGAQQALFPHNDPGQLPITLRVPRTENGSGWNWRYRGIRYGCAPGRSRSAGSSSIFSTAMIQPTCRLVAESPPSYMGRTGDASQSGADTRNRRMAFAQRPRHQAGGASCCGAEEVLCWKAWLWDSC